jgi:hypothetical protein
MTVTATNRKNQFTTNGVTTEFVFNFAITDIQQVKVLTVVNNVETEYTNFTVIESVSVEGGTLTTLDVLTGVDLLVFRDTALTQQVDYVGGGRFPADSHEQALDRLTLQNQEQEEEIDRTLKFNISSDNILSLEDYDATVTARDAQVLVDANAYTDATLVDSEASAAASAASAAAALVSENAAAGSAVDADSSATDSENSAIASENSAVASAGSAVDASDSAIEAAALLD